MSEKSYKKSPKKRTATAKIVANNAQKTTRSSSNAGYSYTGEPIRKPINVGTGTIHVREHGKALRKRRNNCGCAPIPAGCRALGGGSPLAGHSESLELKSDRSAAAILRNAAEVIEQRATLRDLPNGERSMQRAVAAYNQLTGASLSELDGWIFMCVLKMARATAGKPQIDDFTDLAGYSALAAEVIL